MLVKYMDDPKKFLVESGLLFELNRLVLHPYGLAIAIGEGSNKEEATIALWDCRDDAEGILFSPEAFEKGKAKLLDFRFKQGAENTLDRRREAVGFIVQEEANV